MKVSLVITTYNWPEALKASLHTAFRQSYDSYEVIVADDGSSDATRDVVLKIKEKAVSNLHHVWHEDRGFRAAAIRNRAIAAATGDYVIFIDGDCLLPPTFIADHISLAQEGCFVAGSRVKIRSEATRDLLNDPENIIPLTRRALLSFCFSRKIKRPHPLLKLPLGPLRHSRAQRWKGAVTCNMAVWRKDLIEVNGFDNAFVGWGLEDSDLVARLLNLGVTRKEGKLYSFVAHLHHEERARDSESVNRERFEKSLLSTKVCAGSGLNEVSQV